MAYKWDEMTPKERDALVAEKVMGWWKVQEFDTVGIQFDVDGNVYHRRIAGYDFRPSSNIQYAWEVIEKLNYAFEIVSVSDGIMCTFQWSDEDKYPRHKSAKATSESAPEAICKATLKAVGIEIE